MKKFVAEDGTNYSVSLNIGVIKRVREQTGVDLLDPTGERTQPAASDLLRTDLVAIGEVVWAICKPDMEKDVFLDLLKGPVLRDACKAFWEEWSDFFLQAGDELVGNQIREMYEATVELAAAAASKTKALFKAARAKMHDELDRDLKKAMNELKPKRRASGSASSPDVESSG